MTDTIDIKTVKSRLVEAAKNKYGEITPCDPPFAYEGDMVLFWFNTPDQSTHLLRSHMIVVSEEVPGASL